MGETAGKVVFAQMTAPEASAIRRIAFGDLKTGFFRKGGKIFYAGQWGRYTVSFPVREDGVISRSGGGRDSEIYPSEEVDLMDPAVLGITEVKWETDYRENGIGKFVQIRFPSRVMVDELAVRLTHTIGTNVGQVQGDISGVEFFWGQDFNHELVNDVLGKILAGNESAKISFTDKPVLCAF